MSGIVPLQVLSSGMHDMSVFSIAETVHFSGRVFLHSSVQA